MARKYDQQYEDVRERIQNHSSGGTHQVRKGVERAHPGYENPEDAERILDMADAYDADNL